MLISLIAALDWNLVIGDATGMPWHVPHDLKRFKALTLGKPVVMGRTTYDILGRPLPGRPNVVLTHDQGFRPAGVHVAYTPHGALGVAELLLRDLGGDEVMIVGGAQVYRLFAAWADRLYLSLIDGEHAGTAYFPDELPGTPWHLTVREAVLGPVGESYTFFQFDRQRTGERTGIMLRQVLQVNAAG